MVEQGINRVVIAGGGTAGWMTAAALSHLVARPLKITLVESDDIGTVGVGEATIPTLLTINRLLKIPEPEFIRETSGTFKLGIQFENWTRPGDRYIHSFGDTGKGCWAGGFQHFWLRGQREGVAGDYGDYCLELKAAEAGKFGLSKDTNVNYAYHLDATRYGQYLRKRAEKAGVQRIEGKINQVRLNTASGNIESLEMADGQWLRVICLSTAPVLRRCYQRVRWRRALTIGVTGYPATEPGPCPANSRVLLYPTPGPLPTVAAGSGAFPCNTVRATAWCIAAIATRTTRRFRYCKAM